MFYNDLFFRVFDMEYIEYKVSVKYITKKLKSDGNEFFLATINQIRANPISSRNLRLNATRLCKVCFCGFPDWPFINMPKVTIAITEKSNERMAMFPGFRSKFTIRVRRYPVNITRILIKRRTSIYFKNRFKGISLKKIFHCSIDCREYP